MSTAWTIAFVALFVFTGFLGIIVLGLLRRAVVALEEAGHHHEAAAVPAMPDSPSFDVVGTAVSPPAGHDWATWGDCTVLFLEGDCEGCQLLAADLTAHRRQLVASGQTVVVVVDSLTGALGSLPSSVVTVLDLERVLAQEWGVQSSPVAYCVTSMGFVVAGTHPHTLPDVLKLARQVAAAQGAHH